MRVLSRGVVFVTLLQTTALYAKSPEEGFLPAVDCILNPSHEIELSSFAPGVLTDVFVRRGQAVVKGQKVAQIDDRIEQVSVMLAEAQAAIDSDLEGGRINFNYDRYAYKRLTDLYRTNVVSEQDKEQAERAVKLSAAAINQANEQHRIRELELERAKALLEQRTVRSPVTGVVQRNLKYIGEYVDEEPIVRIVSLDPLYVETMVPIQHFGQIKPGMLAEVYPELDAQNPRQAKVIAIDPVGDVGSSAFGVQLEMANAGNTLPGGIKCDLKFTEAYVADNDAEVSPDPIIEASLATETEKPSVIDEAESQPLSESANVLSLPAVKAADQKSGKASVAGKNEENAFVAADNDRIEDVIQPTANLPVAYSDAPSVVTPEAENAENNALDISVLDSSSPDTPAQGELKTVKLGPFNPEQAESASQKLDDAGINFRAEQSDQARKIGYILLSHKMDRNPQIIVTDLSSRGLKDVEYINYGAYRGRVSFGVFYSEADARSRMQQIQRFGHQAELVTRYRKQRQVILYAEVLEQDARLQAMNLQQ